MASRLDDDGSGMTESHEINVTPFIDVMLVLLIIFMVAAPLSTVDLPVNLPASSAKAPPSNDKPIFVTLQADLTLSIGEKPVAATGLIEAVASATAGDKDKRIVLRADKTVPYGEVIGLLDRLRDAGYLKVGLTAIEAAK